MGLRGIIICDFRKGNPDKLMIDVRLFLSFHGICPPKLPHLDLVTIYVQSSHTNTNTNNKYVNLYCCSRNLGQRRDSSWF